MLIKKLTSRRLHIPFIQSFKHASACRTQSSSFWVEARSNHHTGYGEGCPRIYVTGETLDSAEAFLLEKQSEICNEIKDLETLKSWAAENRKIIDANPAAWCAIELAILELFAREAHKTIESLLGLPALSDSFHYSAVLGDGECNTFQSQLNKYIRQGFSDFKIKLSGDRNKDKQKFSLLNQHINNGRIRVDANNLWYDPDAAIDYLGSLDTRLFAVEEPVKAFGYSFMEKIACELDTRIILDESFLNSAHFHPVVERPEIWIINLRISKMGGLLRSLEIIEQAKRLGIKIIIGAHVGETSLLTRAALPLARIAGSSLAAQEGAFGTLLLEHDIVSKPLVFGKKGILNPGQFIEPDLKGFGLKFNNFIE